MANNNGEVHKFVQNFFDTDFVLSLVEHSMELDTVDRDGRKLLFGFISLPVAYELDQLPNRSYCNSQKL